jgi:hypothetical protein
MSRVGDKEATEKITERKRLKGKKKEDYNKSPCFIQTRKQSYKKRRRKVLYFSVREN